MKETNDTKLTMKFFLDCSMNVQMNKIRDAMKELGLLKHWALNFENMHPIYKNEVIREINKRANEDKFYDIFAPMEEVEE